MEVSQNRGHLLEVPRIRMIVFEVYVEVPLLMETTICLAQR